MTKFLIRLNKGEWEFDEDDLLGSPGGFGEVFWGAGYDGAVAVKRLKLRADQAAHRELQIGEHLIGRGFDHVVPILDAGQDAESDRYFLVMPVCDGSLQDAIDDAPGQMEVSEAIGIASAILTGLEEVNDIVHRDLKPSNVLLHNGNWKIADFGIAKFVEDSTSVQTLRDCLSPAYAAPEQWRGEKPTCATDIYALGCIMHAIVTGYPPFEGSVDDLREAHLDKVPERVAGIPPRLSALVSNMVRKPQAVRPTRQRCARVIGDARTAGADDSPGRQALLVAADAVAAEEASVEAARTAAESKQREREDLFRDAKTDLIAIRDRFFDDICQQSESARVDLRDTLVFGHARCRMEHEPQALSDKVVKTHMRGNTPYAATGWDVLGWATMQVEVAGQHRSTGYCWAATLLFADQGGGEGFRWYEVGFYGRLDRRNQHVPFALAGYEADVDQAIGPSLHTVEVAYGPLPIDGENEEEFLERWRCLVSRAATGSLREPRSLPIDLTSFLSQSA